jgi:hypothetical protein
MTLLLACLSARAAEPSVDITTTFAMSAGKAVTCKCTTNGSFTASPKNAPTGHAETIVTGPVYAWTISPTNFVSFMPTNAPTVNLSLLNSNAFGKTYGVSVVLTWFESNTVTHSVTPIPATTNMTLSAIKVESKTVKNAADGITPNTRTTVGVCEQVIFTIVPSMTATWTASDGQTGNGATFTWDAPDKKGKVSVAVTSPLACDIEMDVIKPDSAKWTKLLKTITTGYQNTYNVGGLMQLAKLKITPDIVNFERIVVFECSGPASDISGIFTNSTAFPNNGPSAGPPPVSAGFLWHSPAINRAAEESIANRIDANNYGDLGDEAGWGPPGFPFKDYAGSFTWVIPMGYRLIGTTRQRTIFATLNQVMSFTTNRMFTVTKDDASICHLSCIAQP